MAAYSKTDGELFRLLVQSDENAFRELYNRYWEKLFQVATNLLRDPATAEELVQDVWMDLWNRKQSIELQGEISAYLAVAVKYRVLNMQARRKRERDYAAHVSRTGTGYEETTQQWLGFEELKTQLSLLVNRLPERARIAYQLSREQGLSHKEIAGEMNISEKAVERNLTRALKSIREGLNGLFKSLFSFF